MAEDLVKTGLRALAVHKLSIMISSLGIAGIRHGSLPYTEGLGKIGETRDRHTFNWLKVK